MNFSKPLIILMLTTITSTTFANQSSTNKFMLSADTTSASQSITTTTGTSYFDDLGSMFASGTLPVAAKLLNIAWAGRCFQATAPNDPINAGYIFRQSPSLDVGPLGSLNPLPITYEADTYWRTNEAPNYYDHMTLAQALSDIGDMAAFKTISFTHSTVVLNLSEDGTTISELRTSGPYLVEELSQISSVGPVTNQSKTVYVRCYYFIPDYNQTH